MRTILLAKLHNAYCAIGPIFSAGLSRLNGIELQGMGPSSEARVVSEQADLATLST